MSLCKITNKNFNKIIFIQPFKYIKKIEQYFTLNHLYYYFYECDILPIFHYLIGAYNSFIIRIIYFFGVLN